MVLDPITALSLAGTVVQFIDFGSKILTHGLTLMHREGGPMFDVVGELEMTTAYLSDLSTKLSQPFSAATTSSTYQEPMDRLCQASVSIAGELLGKIERLRVEGKNRKWRCLREAIRWAWNEDALQDLVSRLSKLREMVELHVLVALREKIDTVSLQHSKRFDKLDFDTQRIVTALIGTQEAMSNQIKVHTQKIQNDLSAELKDQTRAVTQMMGRLEPLFAAHELSGDRARQIHSKSHDNVDSHPKTYTLADMVDESDDWLKDIWNDESQTREIVNNSILQEFYFQSMSDRKDGVSNRHPNTFKWILEEPKHREDEPPWSNFANWLQNGEQIYWINGKAASGKSTLMRYLCEDRRTFDLLETWARPEAPTLTYHFFWNSGTIEQRSYEGLLKTILYSVLSHHKQLIPFLLPVKYARKYAKFAAPLVGKSSATMLKGQSLVIDGNATSIREPSALIESDVSSVIRIPWKFQGKLDASTTSATNEIWTLKDLMQLFKRLIQQREIPIKLCLFIDGLDEYDGCYEELVDFLKLITTSTQVKACVASRTLRPFEDAFGSGDTLRLQDWTCCDIELYVHDHLSQHPKYSQLTREEPSRAPELVQEIVRKANGVFLWVKLVVQSLRKGLRNRDSIKDLQRRLHLLPGDLEQLYNHIFANIDEFYKAQASEYFQLVRSARRQRSELNDNTEALTLIELSFAADDDHELAIKAELKRPSPNWLRSRCELAQTRLQVRCLGLLEIHRSREVEKWQVGYFNKVQYLH